MAKVQNIKVKGMKQWSKALDEFQEKTQRSFMTTALKAGAKPIVASAKGHAAKQSHALADSIQTKAKRRKYLLPYESAVIVGPYRDDTQALAKYADYYGIDDLSTLVKNGIRHGHLVEFGHSSRNGNVPPRPFLRPAAEGSKGAFLTQFRVALERRMSGYIKTLTRKNRAK